LVIVRLRMSTCLVVLWRIVHLSTHTCSQPL
jgi:hypothetical protein